MGLKYISAFRELCFKNKDHAQWDLLICDLFVVKTSRVVHVFQVLCIVETKSRFINIKYWVKQICLELKVWKPRFQNIRTKICKFFLKKNRDAVFNLVTFQAKGLQLYWKETPAYALSVECRPTATSEISSTNQIAVPDKFS